MRILYIDVDTLRADHTGPYGYPRKITPNLDALSERAVVFDRCYASDSPCAPSRAAWTSVQFGITTGAIGNFGPAADIHMFDRTKYGPYFGSHLYRNGIPTTSISCFPDRHYAYWFVGNFSAWSRPSLSGGDDEDAGDVTNAARSWLDRHAREESWLLHVHYWDPHLPYVEPSRWYDLAMESGAPPAWPDAETIAFHNEHSYGPHTSLDLYEGDGSWSVPPPPAPNPSIMPDSITSRDDFIRFVTGYDGAVAYFDHHLGILLDVLAANGVLDDTAVIVTSDHGECLGEDGCYGDHPMANHASHHVPLVMTWPGLTDQLPADGRHVDSLMYHIDLCPTICELLGIPIPPGWEGASMAPVLRGEPSKGHDSLVLSHGAYTYQRTLVKDGLFYTRTLHPGCWSLEQERCYDISTGDTAGVHDLAPGNPSLCAGLSGELEEWRMAHATMTGEHADPMEAARYEGPRDAFSVERYVARLRQTGRDSLARDLEARLASRWVASGHW